MGGYYTTVVWYNGGMKNLNDTLKNSGIPPNYIGIISVIITVAIIGILAFGYIYDTINNIPLPVYLVLVLGAIGQFVIVTVTTKQTTASINGTAIAAAAATAQGVTAEMNKSAVAVLHSQKLNIESTDRNTKATEDLTDASNEVSSSDVSPQVTPKKVDNSNG